MLLTGTSRLPKERLNRSRCRHTPRRARAILRCMCIGCALLSASAATGLRSWLQNHHFGWLTPRRLRALTIGAVCAAGLVSTVGLSGSSSASVRGSGGSSGAPNSAPALPSAAR